MFKRFFHKLGNFLLMPFREHFLFFIAFFFLATSPYFLWFRISMQMLDAYVIFLIAHSLVFAYLVTLLVCLVKPVVLQKTIQGILLALAAICFAINFYCNLALNSRFDADIVMLMMGTDIKETKEFASSLLPKWIVLSVLGVYLVFIALWMISKRHPLNLGKKTSYLALGGMCICALLAARNWKAWEDGPVKLFIDMTSMEGVDDLKPHYTHPRITFVDENPTATNVVLIIGESFTRCHSSLYNYDKPTNPELSAYRDSSLLFTFDNVDAPASKTSNSILFMLSTYDKADKSSDNSKKWYDYTSLIELMQECGFVCYWFSNQERLSNSNCIARIYADACDKQWFLSKSGKDDYILVDSTFELANDLVHQDNYFIIYHLMGSHFDYSKRYPKEFARFTEKDYLTQPQGHRAILASYDNSILYNDHVVSQLFNLYKDKDAIILYVPDHGQVMYRDPKSPHYYVHGNKDDKVSYALGVEIPFMIFATRQYQKNHPETMQRIKASYTQDKSWNTDDLPYLIMDLIGVKDVDGENVRTKSILN